MARKKPMQYVPLEERPEFLVLVAELMNVAPEQFAGIAMQCVEKYHDAVLAGHVEVLDQMHAAYHALVYKLNGETLLGCSASDESPTHVLARAVAAKPGQVPGWGQAGEFLLEVEGVRVWVVIPPFMLENHRACDLYAVDVDKPFFTASGYRSGYLSATSGVGETVDQAVRRMVQGVMQAEGKLKSIKVEDAARVQAKKRPAWLLDALAGVRSNGQLAMFGDAPKDLAVKPAMDNAARQRAFRARQRELKERQGAREVLLTRDDFNHLYIGIDVFCTLGVHPEFLAAPSYRDSLTRIFKGSHLWCEDFFERLGRDVALLNTEKHRETERKRGWALYEEERQRTEKLRRELAQERADHQFCRDNYAASRQENANLLGCLAELQQLAEELGGPPMKMQKDPASPRELRRRITALEDQNAAEIADRAKAFDAVAVLTARLKAAGLPTDYRSQAGE